jgi:hypothetical protein
VLRIVNRSGNRPSHEGAAAQLDRAILPTFRTSRVDFLRISGVLAAQRS